MLKRALTLLSVLVLSLSLASCYVIPVPQGNVLTAQKMSSIRKGMSSAQVIAILGQPVLNNIYSENRLVYVSSLYNKSHPFSGKQFIIYFRNGRVTSTQLIDFPSKTR